jgi:redox-sensitive bicupin YhaK (pirin superfamily)
LPSDDKLAPPHFAMLWNEAVPRVRISDAAGRITEVTLIAGELAGQRAPAPPPHSWAARPDSDLAIWSIHIEAGAVFTLPAARAAATQRTLYLFRGPELRVADSVVPASSALSLRSGDPVELRAGEVACELLLLQGRPLAEPVVQHGPFVMNSPEQIQQAVLDYQRTRFGGWPWPTPDPVHPRDAGRFARYPGGRVETPGADSRAPMPTE